MVAGGRSEGIRGRKKGGTIVTWYQETRKTKVGRGKSEVYIFNQRVMKETETETERDIRVVHTTEVVTNERRKKEKKRNTEKEEKIILWMGGKRQRGGRGETTHTPASSLIISSPFTGTRSDGVQM